MDKYSQAINLMLADQMARVYSLNRGAAIQRAARVIRRETRDKGMHELATLLIATSNEKRVQCVEKLAEDMFEEGLL